MTDSKTLVFPPRWRPRPDPANGPPPKPFYMTVNEINSYLRCHRAWDITSANRMGLSRKGTPAPALHIGSAMHYAIARQALGQDPEDALREFFAVSIERLTENYRKVVGTGLSLEEQLALSDQRTLCFKLLRAYYARYSLENPIKPFRMLAPEVTFSIPLFPGEYPIFLVGTIDAVTVDQFGNPVPLERKTYSRRPKRENWRFNHQIYGYSAALQVLTGRRVPYALYDGINKKEPTTPRTLKNGTVSRKWIDTTYDIYHAEVMRVFGRIPNDYLDILNRLKMRDYSPENAFFTRFRVPIVQHAVTKWWDDARTIALEAAHWPSIYPNFEWQGCPMCRVKDLCYAIQGGEDTQDLIRHEYESRHTPTISAVLDKAHPIVRPGMIKRPSDFAQFGHVSLDYEAESDPILEVAPSGD